MALEPITRQEKIIAGQDLTPITRMEKFLKNFGGSGGGGGAQPDLSQTDTTKPDYVKGVIRQESLPDGYPYSEKQETTIVDKLEISGFIYDQELGSYMGSSKSIMELLNSDPTIRDKFMNGKPITIIWDDTPYDCVFNISMSAFGNPSLIYDSAPDTGEPFLINTHGIFTKENNDSHTVGIKIVDEIIYPMDKKYLPVGLEVTFRYYNGSFTNPNDITHDDLMKATLSGEPITAKLFNVNEGFTTDAFYVGRYGDTFAFIVYAILEDSAHAYIFTCTSETGWTHRIHGMKAAAHVPNAAGDTPTAAEFNALLTSLRRVGILETP